MTETPLDAFFDAIAPMLYARATPTEVEADLGPCPSGTDNLGFYAELVERNWFKIMRDMYVPLRKLILRDDDTLWGTLVRDYAQAHPAADWNPNLFAAQFSAFLSERREAVPEQPVIYEELADFLYTQHVAFASPHRDEDGFEERIFIRQYTYPVHEICAALGHDPNAEIAKPDARVLVIYRHSETYEIRLAFPTVAALGALARRQGLGEVPEMFAALPASALDAAESTLVDQGVLYPAPPAP